MNLFLLTEFCIKKETVWLLVNQAARFPQPLCLAHPSLTNSLSPLWNMCTMGADLYNMLWLKVMCLCFRWTGINSEKNNFDLQLYCIKKHTEDSWRQTFQYVFWGLLQRWFTEREKPILNVSYTIPWWNILELINGERRNSSNQ